MKTIQIMLTTAAALLLSSSASASLPDLCDDVYLDPTGSPITDSEGTTLARFCEWTGPDAPLWADNVCCSITSTATCTPTDANGRCVTGIKMWCDYGEQTADEVTCYQPFPDACEAGFCNVAPPSSTPGVTATPLCCYGDQCYELSLAENCGGLFLHCASPYTNEDGTVGCADD